jgi:hypothetical protein
METGSAGSANISGTTNHIIKFTGATTGGTKVLMTGQTWNRNNDTSQIGCCRNFKIAGTDGTEGVLTSDAAGLASWTTPAVASDANTNKIQEKNANEDIIL